MMAVYQHKNAITFGFTSNFMLCIQRNYICSEMFPLTNNDKRMFGFQKNVYIKTKQIR